MPEGTDRYNVDQSNFGARLEERLRAVEQKVEAALNRNPLNNAVFRGTMRNVDEAGNTLVEIGPSGFSMYDADGDLRARIGITEAGRYGLLVLDAGGTVQRLWADERGILSPYLSAPLVDADSDYKVVTSGSFVATHRAQFETITSQGLYCWVTATAAAGTTGEIRLRNTGTGATTEAVVVPDGGQVTQQFRWLHGSALSAGPITFEVQARRTTGAGDLNVYRAPGMWMTAPGLCVADGVA